MSVCSEPEYRHIQAGNMLVEQAVAVSQSNACATSKTCFQCDHSQVQNIKLPEGLLVDSMT